MQVRHRSVISGLILWFVLADDVHAEWGLFEQSHISGSIRGAVRKGHILKTASGHFYEVAEYIYLYEYEYHLRSWCSEMEICTNWSSKASSNRYSADS